MDRVAVLVKVGMIHPRPMTAKVEDTVHLLLKIRMPKIVDLTELQLVNMVDNLKVNMRMTSIPPTDVPFLLQIANTRLTLLGLWDLVGNILIGPTDRTCKRVDLLADLREGQVPTVPPVVHPGDRVRMIHTVLPVDHQEVLEVQYAQAPQL